MKDRESGDFEGAAAVIVRLAERVGEWARTGPLILNVNFPPGPAAGWGDPVVTRLGSRSYSDELIEKEDPRGRKYYWIGGSEPEWEGGADTDFAVVHGGSISVTPLNLELTDEATRQGLAELGLGLGLDRAEGSE